MPVDPAALIFITSPELLDQQQQRKQAFLVVFRGEQLEHFLRRQLTILPDLLPQQGPPDTKKAVAFAALAPGGFEKPLRVLCYPGITQLAQGAADRIRLHSD